MDVTAQSGTGGTLTVTPQNECGNAPAITTNIGVLALPSLDINFPESVFSGETATFSFTTDQALTTREWSLGDGTTASTDVVEHSYETPGDYPISLTITAASGCENSASGIYTVSNEPDLSDRAIKNVITANGDDKNRVLFIENLHRYPENEVRFLDRWGVEIFSTKNYQNDWEARAKDGQYLPAGQYMCIVKLNSSGKVISRTVSIIKGR
jgi:gliding motility-associated-like protein